LALFFFGHFSSPFLLCSLILQESFETEPITPPPKKFNNSAVSSFLLSYRKKKQKYSISAQILHEVQQEGNKKKGV
jgi:hypothetical protein